MEDRMNQSTPRAAGASVAALLLCSAIAAATPPQTVNAAIGEQVGAEKAAAASQARIDKLDDDTQRMLTDYRGVLTETDSLRRYNEQLEKQIKSQNEEMVSIQKQIEEIERTNREIVPLMQKMIDTLDQFVRLDLPFLLDERTKRVADLRAMMSRADVSTSEKYRRILEAYTIELEFGRTLEAYQGKLGEGEAAKTVDFLRVGRIALMYQALDGGDTGYWDADKKAWEKDNGYRASVKEGLKVARKQVAPDLLQVPVRAAPKGGE
jgi:hypothetical protein